MELDDWIKNKNMLFSEFAECLGISVPTLTRLRRGDFPWMVHVISSIEDFTNKEVGFHDIISSQKARNRHKKHKKNKDKARENENNVKASKTLE